MSKYQAKIIRNHGVKIIDYKFKKFISQNIHVQILLDKNSFLGIFSINT